MVMLNRSEVFRELRQRAGDLLESKELNQEHLKLVRPHVEELLHELETYDAELYLQNQELRRNELVLENALNRFETLFSALPLAAIVVDRRGVIMQSNDHAVELFQFRNRSTLENHSLLRLLIDKDRNALFSNLDQQSPHEIVQIGPLQLNQAENRLVDFYLTRLPEAFHLEPHILITCIERTEEYNQKNQMMLLNRLVDNTDARIFAFDQNNRLLFANQEELERIGMSEQEVLGQRRDKWMSAEDAMRRERRDSLVYSTGRSVVLEESDFNKHGQRVYYMVHKFPLLDDESEVFAVGTIANEFTENKNSRDRLNLAMQAYSMGQEAILITDASNKIINVNEAFERITGYRENEVLGKNPHLLSSGRHDKEFYKAMWNLIEEEGQWNGELLNRRKNGELYAQQVSISRIPNNDYQPTTNYIAVFSDITHRKQAEEEIEKLAFYDSLTGLPNRQLLADRVSNAIYNAQRHQNGFALVFFDLDRFKNINDVHGHAAGDAVLLQVAKRCQEMIRQNDTLSRIGGDEYVLLLNDADQGSIHGKLSDILNSINKPYSFAEEELTISASFGIAMYPEDGDRFDELLKKADTAMYAAKDHGRERIEFFNPQMESYARASLEMEQALRHAILNRELTLVYQPLIDLDHGVICGAEALMRWNSEKLGPVSPSEFIPLAERTGIIHDIGDWLMAKVALDARNLKERGHEIRLAMNLSARQFEEKDFDLKLLRAFEEQGVNPGAIELEITETSVMSNPDWSLRAMKLLKAHGFQISLDDFGTGYSSMAYLHWMPIDYIKIDQSFVKHIQGEGNDDIICSSIIQLAHNLGHRTIAEGVEEVETQQYLRQQHCDIGQGYHFGRPMPLVHLIDSLEQTTAKSLPEFSDETEVAE